MKSLIAIADSMRGGLSCLSNNYEKEMAEIAYRVSTTQTVNGIEFIYQSAKDTLREHGVSARQHLKELMSIGMLFGMSNENFDQVKNSNGFIEISRDQLRKFMES